MSHGFSVTGVGLSDELFGLLADRAFDLVIAQLSPSDVDEFTLLTELRRVSAARCIILSDSEDLVDRVLALEMGAEDYLDRSIDRRELLARIRVVLRRAAAQRAPTVEAASPRGQPATCALTFERVQRRLLHSDGATVALTTAEYNLLASFADNRNVPLTRERLYQLVYNRRWSAYDRTLDTLVAKLRRKIERDPQRPELIKTVHGTGYIFTGVNFI